MKIPRCGPGEVLCPACNQPARPVEVTKGTRFYHQGRGNIPCFAPEWSPVDPPVPDDDESVVYPVSRL